MRTVSSLVCSSLSFCFTSTGRAFQYKVEAVCTSKLSQDLVLLSITSGIALPTGIQQRSQGSQGSQPKQLHAIASRDPTRRLPRFRRTARRFEFRTTSKLPQLPERWLHALAQYSSGSFVCSFAPGAGVRNRYILDRARLMILSLSCQVQSLKSPLPGKTTSFWFRSTQRLQTHSRLPRTRRAQPTSPSPFTRPFRGFCSSAAFAVANEVMPDASTEDMLFAAAMPKEEIGALEFLKVVKARLHQSGCFTLHMPHVRFAPCAATTRQ